MEQSTPQNYANLFSMGYVLRATAKHMRKSIDISIRRTFERLPDFVENEEKSKEIFSTLAYLHKMRKDLDDFQAKHAEQFRK